MPFARSFPKRFFDVGICEAHAVTSAAGLAISGFIPVVAIYSSFLQRAYDQIIHDVALQNLHVVFCIDRAGVVGDDGETHQGVFDIAFMSQIPNMAVLAPASFYELEHMLKYAVLKHRGPICIRYPRGREQYKGTQVKFVFGKSELVSEGGDVTIVAVGNLVRYAAQAAQELLRQGIFAEVINVRTVVPLDKETILRSVRKTGDVLVLEDGVARGGVGDMVARLLVENGVTANFEGRGYDEFVAQAKVARIHEKYGLDTAAICKWAVQAAEKKRGYQLGKKAQS